MTPKCTVYVIRSETGGVRHYVGRTANLTSRLASHNAGESPQTARHRPWKVVVALQFAAEERAASFEKYLKSGAGAEFLNRYLL